MNRLVAVERGLTFSAEVRQHNLAVESVLTEEQGCGRARGRHFSLCVLVPCQPASKRIKTDWQQGHSLLKDTLTRK